MANLPGLVSGSWRGIEFHMPTSSTRPGRRVAEVPLPGVDDAAYDDFGRAAREINIEGLIVGDDYMARAAALEAAFETAGAAMLIHPFKGPMNVILADPATINYSTQELRVIRFSARFKRVSSGFNAGLSGLFGIASAVLSVIAFATALSSSVGTRAISAARSRAVTRSLRIVTSAVSNLQPVTGSRRFVPRLKAQVARSTASTPATYDDAIRTVANMIGDATIQPWVSPAAEATTETSPSSAALLSLGVALASRLSAEIAESPSDSDKALLLASAVHIVAQAISQIDYTGFESTEAAIEARDRALAVTNAIIAAVDEFSTTSYVGETADIIGGLYALQAEITGTVNEIIGRLPKTLLFNTTAPVDAFVLANHVAGDDPSTIEAVYKDIVKRNNCRHPARIPAGLVKVIKP